VGIALRRSAVASYMRRSQYLRRCRQLSIENEAAVHIFGPHRSVSRHRCNELRLGPVESRDLHREAKARAALDGMSLSDYLLRELRHALDRPTLDEMRKRLSRRQPVQLHPAPAAAVRAERNTR
jgi:hypothetical protein